MKVGVKEIRDSKMVTLVKKVGDWKKGRKKEKRILPRQISGISILVSDYLNKSEEASA